MISVSYDHGGAVTGVVINETVYSPAAILALAKEVERLRVIEAAARDVVARASHAGMGSVVLSSADFDGLIIALEAFPL